MEDVTAKTVYLGPITTGDKGIALKIVIRRAPSVLNRITHLLAQNAIQIRVSIRTTNVLAILVRGELMALFPQIRLANSAGKHARHARLATTMARIVKPVRPMPNLWIRIVTAS